MRWHDEAPRIVTRGLFMSKSYRYGCVDPTWRIPDDELQSLIASISAGDHGAVRKLFRAITPLLIAFYDGQAQAGRLEHDNVGHLVQMALLTVYRRRAACCPDRPFRAWLVDVARSTLSAALPDVAKSGKLSALRHQLQDSAIQSPAPESDRLMHEIQVAWLAHA